MNRHWKQGDIIEGPFVLACIALIMGLPSALTQSYLFCKKYSLYSSLSAYLKCFAVQSDMPLDVPSTFSVSTCPPWADRLVFSKNGNAQDRHLL